MPTSAGLYNDRLPLRLSKFADLTGGNVLFRSKAIARAARHCLGLPPKPALPWKEALQRPVNNSFTNRHSFDT